MTAPDSYTLVASRGCGSAIVEACFAVAELACCVEEVDHESPGPGRDRLLALNPLGQVPALILPDGTLLTESAAMVLHLGDVAPEAGLVPPPGDPERPRFLRWLAFLVGAVYPTFTYGDDPSRYVSGEAAAAELRASTDAYRERCWRQVEGEVVPGGPWFLGSRLSALDIYVSVMTRWRPRRPWFAERCPRLHGIALALDRDPRLAAVWARNWG
jgi:GST-like protein